ncbi:MAG: preprotein translocase subunit SecA [Akkermansiaceae bacterium]|nr:preprotein translocase subunit SecA [Akkermansiaceae bacterium]
MIQWLFPKIIGGKNEREVNRIRPTVARINELEGALQHQPFGELPTFTTTWQNHLARYHPLAVPAKPLLERMDEAGVGATAAALEQRLSVLRGEFPALPSAVTATVSSIERAKSAFHECEGSFGKSRAKYLERILPEAYAVVKNAARRLCGSEIMVSGHALKWDMVHFDVQLIGGIAIHRGMIAEMQTGEGKTLVATLPVYLNALTGLGVHVVTVNDYLAKRDAEWMGALFRSLGLTVGCIQNQMLPAERRAEYACDVTYGTNAEFGFDYLRDNGIATTKDEQVQRGHYLAIIDEVDSILIDDARTPLIISGPSSSSSDQFDRYRPLVEQLVRCQTELCNNLAAEAKRLLEKADPAAAGLTLFKLKLGQPRNRQFLRFMEVPEMRRLLEKTELAHQQGAFQKDVFKLKEELYFVIDEKAHDADLMEKGRRYLSPDDPDSFMLPDVEALSAAVDTNHGLTGEQKAAARSGIENHLDLQAGKIHGIAQLLKAYCLYERDVHYVVRDGKITIIDESTGREMPGRRWSDGLHQAVEAKERVAIEKENQTYATITIQNYFRLYEKLAGMTGTAETEAAEFHDIYQLDVLPIPTNAPNIRNDLNDQIFRTRREKLNAVIAQIDRAHANGQPVLVGTASVESSETLSRMLKRAKIPHSVLNAKLHQQEAEIVAQAGQPGTVTVATNMAGRGSDIKLGAGVAGLGGLFVIGTERHQSRRIDRQLRGRCSRQGDPGRSQFFISLEDDLMRNHAAPDRMAALLEQSGVKGGKARHNPSLGKLVETAQRKVEQRDYKGRKRVLDFDDVMNLQREIVYGYRNEVLAAEVPRRLVMDLIEEVIPAGVREYLAGAEPSESDTNQLLRWVNTTLPVSVTPVDLLQHNEEAIAAVLVDKVRQAYENRVGNLPLELLDQEVRRMVLAAIDRHWQAHLSHMDELREGVYLRAQGQKDPLVEYKNEAYALFATLIDALKLEALQNVFRSAVELAAFLSQLRAPAPTLPGGVPARFAVGVADGVSTPVPSPTGNPPKLTFPGHATRSSNGHPGRNSPCSCGSGRKFKQCCGRMA